MLRNLQRPLRLVAMALPAAFATPAPTAACVFEPFFSMHRDERSTALLVRAAADSVYAG